MACDFKYHREIHHIVAELNPTAKLSRRVKENPVPESSLHLVHPSVLSLTPNQGLQVSDFTTKPKQLKTVGSTLTGVMEYESGLYKLKNDIVQSRRLRNKVLQSLRQSVHDGETRMRRCRNGATDPYHTRQPILVSKPSTRKPKGAGSPTDSRSPSPKGSRKLLKLGEAMQALGATSANSSPSVRYVSCDTTPQTQGLPDIFAGSKLMRTSTILEEAAQQALMENTTSSNAPMETSLRKLQRKSTFFMTQAEREMEQEDALAKSEVSVAESTPLVPGPATNAFLDTTLRSSGGIGSSNTSAAPTPRSKGSRTPANNALTVAVGGDSRRSSEVGDDQRPKSTKEAAIQINVPLIPAARVLSREWVAPTAAGTVLPPIDGARTSKLVEHAHFKGTLRKESDAFFQKSSERIAAADDERKAKYWKKYKALDLQSNGSLKFHATPQAVLHHVEQVITRDERITTRGEEYEKETAWLSKFRAVCFATYGPNARIDRAIDIACSYVDLKHPSPRLAEYNSFIAAVSTIDLLLDEVVTVAVHLGALFHVPEPEAIEVVRKHVWNFIVDRESELDKALTRIDKSMPIGHT